MASKKIEFLIVGQGLAGTLLAHEMYRNNIDFRIVSSSEKSAASKVAAGMVNPLVFKRLTKSWLADDLLPVMNKTYDQLENLLGEKFYYPKDIIKPLSQHEKELWQERKVNPDFSKYISSVENQSNINGMVKADGYGRVTNSGYLDLKSFLKISDSFFRSKNRIIDSTFSSHEINAQTNFFQIENVSASKIVFCEGVHITQNHLFNFVKMNPTKGEILLIKSFDLSEEFILNKQVFVLPVGKQLFKVGSTYEWKDLSEKTTEKGKDSIVERLEKLVSAKYTIQDHFVGIRPTVSDRRPILGIYPENKNISVFNGLGTKGVMLAPYFAKEMLKVLYSENYRLNADVDLNRFCSE